MVYSIVATSSVQEIFVVVRIEIGLGAGLAAKRHTITNLLQVVEPAGDAAIAGAVEGIERDAGATVHAGVDLGTGQDGIAVSVHDAGGAGGVGVDEVGTGIGRVIRALGVAVAQRSLDGGQRRDGLAVALELGLALTVGRFDGCLNLGDGLGVGLRDDEADRELRGASVDALGLPDVGVRPAGVGAGNDLHGIGKLGVLIHRYFPP